MSRPTVTVISSKGESTKDTITVPNVFKVSLPTFRNSRLGADFFHATLERCIPIQKSLRGEEALGTHSSAIKHEQWLDNN
jgi:hypothetical protein